MVSGFLISPNDHERIFSGEAREMRIWSNVGAAATGLKILRTSWFIGLPSAGSPACNFRVRLTHGGARSDVARLPAVRREAGFALTSSPAPHSDPRSASP